MRLRIAVVATALAVVSVLEAQSVDPALTEAIAGRDKASIARDPATVGKYTADDYFAVNPNGVLNTKQQRLAGLKMPSNPTAKPQLPLRTEAVTMYGAGAAVARMKQVDNRQLAVWIKNPSGWQMTAIHVIPDSFIPAPPPQERPKAAQPSNVPAQSGLSGDRAAVFASFKQIQDAFFSGDRATYDKLTAPEHVRMNARSRSLCRRSLDNYRRTATPAKIRQCQRSSLESTRHCSMAGNQRGRTATVAHSRIREEGNRLAAGCDCVAALPAIRQSRPSRP